MAKMMLEIQRRGLNQYQHLEHFPVTIGRALDNDVILSDRTVSPHHLRLEQDDKGCVFIHNLAVENGTRLNDHPLGQQPVQAPIPSQLVLGDRRLRLVTVDTPVENTYVSHCRSLFTPLCKPFWAVALLLLAVGGMFANNYLDIALQKDALFYFSGLLPSLLWILFWTLTISGITRLITHRWEFTPALSVVSLFSLVPLVLQVAGEGLDYFLTSDKPTAWLMGGVGDFLLLPVLVYAYLHWVLNQRHLPAVGFALVLSALPLGLRAISLLDQVTVESEFSSEPYYNQTLSSLNLHANPALPLADYLKKATEALPSQVEE